MSTAPAAPLNLAHLQWRAPEFLLVTGGHLSSAQHALEYFSLSPFFDKASSNAQLRMQMMFSRGGMDGVDEEKELSRFTGLEFVVAPSSRPQDDLFVIHKRQRASPTETTVVGAYYILNGNVYQAPSLFEVLNERVLTSLHALSTSLSALTALKPRYTPERLTAWDIKPPPASAAALPTSEGEVHAAPEQAAGGADGGDEDDEFEAVLPPAAAGDAAPAAGGEKRPLDPAEATDGAPSAPTKRAALDAATAAEEDEQERPGEAFNPLLFRAMQGVAARTAAEAQVAGQ
ncbi:hypothetical protein Rhopal_007873-T1 [Rhodotorula paludigena]|uniref:Mediator of RNA polymerase II transcription subunit 6 n=1 Tax=Rhodotorula paludigena TaxID=86838 RepID=A0AAV5GZ37_9BASI|nr:hypothetical protein Rhopal_007873-T1 [Rhodotorula paludigena]